MYEGEWKAGKREGRGKCTWASGAVYEGEWKADKREGRGKMTYAGRDVVHDGLWSNDQPKFGADWLLEKQEIARRAGRMGRYACTRAHIQTHARANAHMHKCCQ